MGWVARRLDHDPRQVHRGASSRLPGNAPMHGLHVMAGDWMLMAHGYAWGVYSDQGGPRGDSQFGSINWAMLMASHELAGGLFTFRFMPSFGYAATVSYVIVVAVAALSLIQFVAARERRVE